MANQPRIGRTQATGAVWRASEPRHLPPEENRGRHNVFVTCLVGGQVVRDGSVQIRWGWEGQGSGEQSPNKVCDKRAPDPSTDIPIERDMRVWCEVVGLGLESDRVINLHAQFPDEGDGNTMHHNSWAVTFAVENNIPEQPPVSPPPPVSQPPTQPQSSASNSIFGLHDPGGEQLMLDAGRAPGWIVFTEEIGRNPHDQRGKDFQSVTARGLASIVRLNNGYGSSGTIPRPEHYSDFATRCANYVANSRGNQRWIIGNEISMDWEWPDGQPITLADYVACFKLCRDAIKQVQPGAIVIPQGPATWNANLKYAGNPNGDWVQQLTDMLTMIGNVDGISLHTYTHGHDPALVTSEATMDAPFERRRFHFRAYIDFMQAIPAAFRTLPVYITESNPDGWQDVNNGWVQAAYAEIDRWNQMSGNQQIECLCLFRWPVYGNEKFAISSKRSVIEDFQAALKHDYQPHRTSLVAPVKPTPKESDVETIIFPKFTGLITGYYGSIYKNSTGAAYAHEGLDLAQPMGTPVYAPAGGVVVYSGSDPAYGEYIRTYHPQLKLCFFFAHLSERKVQSGNSLTQGQLLGLTGNTGNSSGPHLHFEVRQMNENGHYMPGVSGQNNARLDPLAWLAGWLAAGNAVVER